tara:strand:+ start:206 stop:1153 length:948 start_codon:yes stop_codon:yes gene_type:complete
MNNLIISYFPILLITVISFFLCIFFKLQDKNKIINLFYQQKVFLSGGFFFYITFLYYYTNLNLYLFIFLSALLLIGLLDDKYDLKVSTRFIFTFISILFFLILENNYITYFSFVSNGSLIINLILTSVCILGFLHMTNMSDGKNGHLMTYFVLILCFFFYKLEFYNNDHFLHFVLISSIWFLVLNLLNLSQLGNSGVIVISLIFYFLIQTYYKLEFISEIDIFVFFSFLLFDGIRVSSIRIFNGRSPFTKDLLHLHFLVKKWYIGYSIIFLNYIMLLIIYFNFDFFFYFDMLICLFLYINVLFLSKLLNRNSLLT